VVKGWQRDSIPRESSISASSPRQNWKRTSMALKQLKKLFWNKLGDWLVNIIVIMLSVVALYLLGQLLVNIFILKVY
jgi:hypothetical protein